MHWQPQSVAPILTMIYFINYLLNNGVPQETIILILMLPIIATIIAFSRQIIGIKTFGIYTPLIITFVFLAIDIRYGIIVFITVLLAGSLVRIILKRFRFLYLPRMAILVIIVALIILLMFGESAYSQRTEFIGTSIFPILIMIILVEKFISAQIEKGARTAILLTIETLIIAIICYIVVRLEFLRSFVLAKPGWVIAGSIVANILLGKWTGLRLFEFIRFKDVIKYVELPEKK